MSAATVCVFRTWKIEGCAGFGRRPLRLLGLFVVPRRSGFFCALSLAAPLCREAPLTLPALCSRLPASQLPSPLFCQRGRTEKAQSKAFQLLLFFLHSLTYRVAKKKKEKKNTPPSTVTAERVAAVDSNRRVKKRAGKAVRRLIDSEQRALVSCPTNLHKLFSVRFCFFTV